ncbi:MAG: discoidin domain-containing protein [Chitinispirillaceae bacterium]|nr:discoidin domain-containing protein [Chitinispirillaceae bacterium]
MPLIRRNAQWYLCFLALCALFGIVSIEGAGWQTIHNDFYWYDEDGNAIRTRSGDLFKHGDTYYWYGGTMGFRQQTCYASADLIHWEYQGIVLRHETDANRIDIEYNESTEQFVMLLKYDGNGAHLGTATGSAPDGAFTFLGQTLVDDALMGDMSAFKDDDGTLYMAYVSWATGTNAQHGIYRMSEDYVQLDTRIYLWNRGGREAPMIFKRNGIYYYATSRTDWTASSETQYYSATDLSGPWSNLTMLSTPGSDNSWDSQCDWVFPIEGTDGTVYVYGGDRWEKPDPRREGDYVWLPLEFDGDKPVLNYYQDWEIDVEAGTWRPFDHQRNLALRKPAAASSESGGNSAANVTDSATYLNYLDTRWQSAAGDPQWIMVDLESERSINRVILKWHENYGRAFQLQVSTDASAWTDVYSTARGARRSVTDITFNTVTARYVRMFGTRQGGSNGYSLFDFMVLNDSLVTPVNAKKRAAEGKPVLSVKKHLCRQKSVVSYYLPFAASIRFEVFDMQGKLIKRQEQGFQCQGNHEEVVSNGISQGLYLLRIMAGERPIGSTKFVSGW